MNVNKKKLWAVTCVTAATQLQKIADLSISPFVILQKMICAYYDISSNILLLLAICIVAKELHPIDLMCPQP